MTTGYKKAARASWARESRQVKCRERYSKYLEPNCTTLCRVQRSSSLLQEICNQLRKRDRKKDKDWRSFVVSKHEFFPTLCLMWLCATKTSCSATNWHQLWFECKFTDPLKCLYICRASYHTTGHNRSDCWWSGGKSVAKVQLCMRYSVCYSRLRCPAHQEHQHCSRSGDNCNLLLWLVMYSLMPLFGNMLRRIYLATRSSLLACCMNVSW